FLLPCSIIFKIALARYKWYSQGSVEILSVKKVWSKLPLSLSVALKKTNILRQIALKPWFSGLKAFKIFTEIRPIPVLPRPFNYSKIQQIMLRLKKTQPFGTA